MCTYLAPLFHFSLQQSFTLVFLVASQKIKILPGSIACTFEMFQVARMHQDLSFSSFLVSSLDILKVFDYALHFNLHLVHH